MHSAAGWLIGGVVARFCYLCCHFGQSTDPVNLPAACSLLSVFGKLPQPWLRLVVVVAHYSGGGRPLDLSPQPNQVAVGAVADAGGFCSRINCELRKRQVISETPAVDQQRPESSWPK